MNRLILFDLDGTLTDSAPGIVRCVQYALEKMGRPVPPFEELTCFVGPPLLEQFMEFCGFTREEAAKAVEYYRERYRGTGIFENQVYPGIPEMLFRLKQAGYRLGVASSKPEIFVRQILEHFDLLGDLDPVAGSELDGRRTDKGEVIEEALRRGSWGDRRNQVIMCGDRCYDARGAADHGLGFVGVSYGYGSRRELEEAGAERIADTVEELERTLLDLPENRETAYGR